MVLQPSPTPFVLIGTYDPAHLLDVLQGLLGVASDAALAQQLEVTAASMLLLRRRRIPLTAGMLIRMSDFSGVSVDSLRTILGDRRSQMRVPRRRRRCAAG